MNVLVIPSIREGCLKKFLKSWETVGDWDSIVIIEDNPKKSFNIENCSWPIYHFSHQEIEENLGDNAWIISKKDSSCRIYGFLAAKKLGAHWILSLDDDCYPSENSTPICEKHLKVIKGFNVCKESAGIRTRGLPYKNLGIVQNVVCNMGLWTKVGDWNAVQSLSDPELDKYFTPNPGNFLAHPNHRYPYCGMNIFFCSDIVPIMYFPLMGQNQPYSRYDDIWCGWIFQRVLQHLRLCWSIGEPFVEHSRASDVFVNLVKEASGYKLNEILWETINDIKLYGATIYDCMLEIGLGLEKNQDNYISKIGKAIKVWIKLCEEK